MKKARCLYFIGIFIMLQGCAIDKSKEYLLKGDEQLEMKNYEYAINNYDKAIEINPKNDAAYFKRGKAFLYQAQPLKSIDDFSNAIKINDKKDIYYVFRGWGWFSIDRSYIEKAIEDVSKALTINTKCVEAYYLKANISLAQGDYISVINICNKAIEIDPQFVMELGTGKWSIYKLRGRGYHNTGQYDNALSDYNKGLEYVPQDEEALTLIGQIFESYKRDQNKAVEYYSKAIAINPRYATAYQMRGYAYILSYKYQDAINDFTMAINILPNSANAYSANAYYGRAIVYIRMKDYSQAVSDLQQAARLGSKEAQQDLIKTGISW